MAQPNPDEQKTSEVEQMAREMGATVGLPALVAAVLPALGGFLFIAFALRLQEWVQSHGVTGQGLFVLAFALTTGLALMPTYALSFGAGVFFGFAWGSGLAVAGAVLGSVVGYLVWGLIARQRVMQVIERHPRARVIRGALVGRSFGRALTLVTLVRVPPNSPFALTNMVMSSVRVNPLVYLIGTGVGIAPRTVLAAYIGAAVESIERVSEGTGPWKWVGIGVGLVVLLFVVWLCGRWARQALDAELGANSR